MSTVVRTPERKIMLYCKGADTVILERLGKNQLYVEKTLAHLEVRPLICLTTVLRLTSRQEYATDGLRTLCIACREMTEAEYREWSVIYDQAAATINGRGEALDSAAEIIEKDMFLLGATAIEDKLQEGVPDTIHTLQMAGIKVCHILTRPRVLILIALHQVWVLTGDRQETAINIGLSCRLISESMNLVRRLTTPSPFR